MLNPVIKTLATLSSRQSTTHIVTQRSCLVYQFQIITFPLKMLGELAFK